MGRVNEAALRGLMGQRDGERRPLLCIVFALSLIHSAWEPNIRKMQDSLSLSRFLIKWRPFLPGATSRLNECKTVSSRISIYVCVSVREQRLYDARRCAAILAIMHVADGYVCIMCQLLSASRFYS